MTLFFTGLFSRSRRALCAAAAIIAVGALSVFSAQDSFAQAVHYEEDSAQAREFVLSQLTRGLVHFPSAARAQDQQTNGMQKSDGGISDVPRVFTQSRDGKQFVIVLTPASEAQADYFVQNASRTFTENSSENSSGGGVAEQLYAIRIIPRGSPDLLPDLNPSYGTWDFIVTSNNDLIGALYYFFDAPERPTSAGAMRTRKDLLRYTARFSVLREGIKARVFVGGYEYVPAVTVPVPLRSLLRMRFDEIVAATSRFIRWEQVLPAEKNFRAYARAQQLASYLGRFVPPADIDNLREPYPQELIQMDTLTADARKKIYDVVSDLFYKTNAVLAYIGSSFVNELQFAPQYENAQRVGMLQSSYIERYADNIDAFFRSVPEINYDALSDEMESKRSDEEGELYYDLEARLYLYAVAYPGAFFLLLSADGKGAAPSYDRAQFVVPYFTPRGSFEVYMSGAPQASPKLDGIFTERAGSAPKNAKDFRITKWYAFRVPPLAASSGRGGMVQ